MSEEIKSIDKTFTTSSEFYAYILKLVLSAEVPYKSIALSRSVDYAGLYFIHIELDDVKFGIKVKVFARYFDGMLYRINVMKSIEMSEKLQVEKIAKMVDLYNLLSNELNDKVINIISWKK